MTLIPLYNACSQLRRSQDTLIAVVLAAVVGGLRSRSRSLPRRWLRAVPVVLARSRFAAASVALEPLRRRPGARAATHVPRRPTRAGSTTPARGPAVYLYDGEPSWNGVWETLFWNPSGSTASTTSARRGARAAAAGARSRCRPTASLFVPPPARAGAAVRGRLDLDRARRRPGGQIDQQGLSQDGLALWKIDAAAARLAPGSSGSRRTATSTPDHRAQLAAYGCHQGTFRLTAPDQGGRDARRRGSTARSCATSFPSPQPTRSGAVRAFPRHRRRRHLHARASPRRTSLGTTVFTFERGLSTRPADRIRRWPPSSDRRFRTGSAS